MINAIIKFQDNKIVIHSEPIVEIGKLFNPGFYIGTTSEKGLSIIETTLPEIHIPYDTEETSLIINTTFAFLSPDIMKKVNLLNFTHKLGILLYGIAGTAKTSLMNFIANELVQNKNAIVFICNCSNSLITAIGVSKMIREIQDNPIFFICDEFERFAKDAESEMKNFLDGVDSINNMLFLAATNYIEKVPKTLSERPSRFKIVQELKGITNKTLMTNILTDISNRLDPCLFTDGEISDKVKELESCTMDQLKHICLDKLTNTFIPKRYSNIGFNKKEEFTEGDKKYSMGLWSMSMNLMYNNEIKDSNI